MSLQEESYQTITRPGDNTGVGIVTGSSGANGTMLMSPAKFVQDGFVVNNKTVLVTNFLNLSTSSWHYPVFVVPEGIWIVTSVIVMQESNSTAAAGFDVTWSARNVAGDIPSGGVSVLTNAPIDVSSSVGGRNNNWLMGALVTPVAQQGPGQQLWIVISGALGGFIGAVQIVVGRIA